MRIHALKDWMSARPLAALGVAALLVLFSLGLRLLAFGHYAGLPFLTFVPAIIAATYFGGRWPGILSVALSAVLAWAFLFPPESQFGFPWPSQRVALLVFTSLAFILVWVIDGFIRSYEGMMRSEAAHEALLSSLEQRVEARTAELSAANAQLLAEIASREQAEEKVAQYERLEAVGQLVGGISHDFNNLLSIVIGNLDLAQRRLSRGDREITHHLEAALDGANRGANLTRRLLAFARKQPLKPAVTDINALVSGMNDLLGSTLGERILIRLQLSGGLWACKIDSSQLENAILNLAVNARDAMPDGGELTIATANAASAEIADELSEGEKASDYVVITVRDTGKGMNEDVLARAFEPFFTTKEVGQGTGLGLSQIHGYLKQSGGHAVIQSRPGDGTGVRLYLPRYTGSESVEFVSVDTPKRQATGRYLGKVLVAEDEDGVRSVAVQVLRDLDYQVLEASNGAAALDIIASEPEIGILLTDVVMPGMLGSELAEKARSLRPGLRVLYMTGYADIALQQNGVLPPGTDLLQKPFTPDQLAQKIGSVTGHANSVGPEQISPGA